MSATDRLLDCTVALADSERDAKRTLTTAERAVYASLPPFRHRDWLSGRLAAKRAIAERMGISDLDCIELRHQEGRAPIPVFVDSGGELVLPIAVSITHREGRGAAVASAEVAGLGIDLELQGSVTSRQSIYFLTDKEKRVAHTSGRTILWVLKEAAWKALACDDRTPFMDVELCFDKAGEVIGVARDGNVTPAASRVTYPWPGFVMAVVLHLE